MNNNKAKTNDQPCNKKEDKDEAIGVGKNFTIQFAISMPQKPQQVDIRTAIGDQENRIKPCIHMVGESILAKRF